MKMQSEIEINDAMRKRTDLLWFFQILYWLAHWLTNFFMQPSRWYKFPDLTDLTLTIVFGFILSVALTFIYHKYSIHKLQLSMLVPATLLFSAFCGLLFLAVGVYTTYLITGYQIKIQSSGGWVKLIVLNTYPFIIWSAIYFCYRAWNEWKIQKMKTDEESLLARNAQLEMLRYQLNPHFLFNTLSSLRALIRIEPKAAENMVTKISEFLRYSLSYENEHEVELCREIEIIKYYLDIEKVRFGDKICVEFNIDGSAEVYPVPVFLIHPLVENAVKHGMQTSPRPLLINITAKIINDELSIDVSNSGRWHQEENGDKKKGKGLENVKKRLELSYPGNYHFEVVKDPACVIVKIRIRNKKQGK